MTKADPSNQRPISRGIAVDVLENGSRQHVLNQQFENLTFVYSDQSHAEHVYVMMLKAVSLKFDTF
jgi:hypothetical protein